VKLIVDAGTTDEFGGVRPCPDAATRMLKMERRAAFHPSGLGGSQAPRRNPPQAPT
jgi:hypothetical protein